MSQDLGKIYTCTEIMCIRLTHGTTVVKKATVFVASQLEFKKSERKTRLITDEKNKRSNKNQQITCGTPELVTTRLCFSFNYYNLSFLYKNKHNGNK